jgi:hypothetical protein
MPHFVEHSVKTMSTLAARKGRSRSTQTNSDKTSSRSRDDVSPTRDKDGAKSKVASSNTMNLVLGSFFLLLLAYLYHRDGDVSLHTSINPSMLPEASVQANEATVAPILRAGGSLSSSLRFVTVVMPSVVNPKQRKRRLEAIADTWGPASRSIYVIHNVQDEYPNPPNGEWPKILTIPANITFDDGLPRLNYVIRQVFKDYSKTDFFYFVNDHTYVIPEHLCFYLLNQDPQKDLYAGHALKNEREAFNSGAAGYILSRNSIKRLVERLDDAENDGEVHHGDSNCVVDQGNKWLQGNPGLVTAKCLHHSLNTRAIDTRESGKYHRFHAFGLVRSVAGTVDEWYIKKHANLEDSLGFDKSYSRLLAGEACCSAETISFHYVESSENQALFQIRNTLLQNPDMDDNALKDLMIQKWPKDRSEVGYYSQVLPAREKEPETWTGILAVMRKLSRKEYELHC